MSMHFQLLISTKSILDLIMTFIFVPQDPQEHQKLLFAFHAYRYGANTKCFNDEELRI